ncbi:MAG TPA: S8 family serine peptidase [Solirubrobacteraceae bacterium]|nr:S8 family serine peptidase [Solirubrobacteraceae bacterium]
MHRRLAPTRLARFVGAAALVLAAHARTPTRRHGQPKPAPRTARRVATATLLLAAAAPAALVPGAGVAAPFAAGTRAGSARPSSSPSPPAPAPYEPGAVVVGYVPSDSSTARATIARAADAVDPVEVQPHTRLLTLAPHASVAAALARLRHTRGVAWAVPDYIAHIAVVPRAHTAASLAELEGPSQVGANRAQTDATAANAAGEPFPNDPGLAKVPGGWRSLQWNFDGTFGVEAPGAWRNLIADHRAGGRGVVVAVLDTGVAYANRGPFRISPDFYRYQFVAGWDFVAHNRFPNDRNGHGTDVAATIAEATNNGKGLTGLAYGVRIMPVRVLDSEGNGDAATIAKGVRFAVNHGARVINLSLEFPGGITASDIPELISALRYAHRHGVVLVGAAGNEAHAAAAYPARAEGVIAVGASTEHGCLASYTNFGTDVALVAPGGGPDANLPGDPNCQPDLASGRDVFQVTFLGTSPRRFGIPGGYEGTSMATPHVAAAAAMIIASGVLGRHPTPAQVEARLLATARPLGGPSDSHLYGAGLLDVAAATAPGGPGAVGG